MSTNSAPKMSALLIGIDRYDSNVVPDLSGCLRDIALMEAYLRESAGISNITKLTSPANEDVKISAPDSLPTANNVIAALGKLAHEAQKNDFIYIHFSGHGSRYPTKFQELHPSGGDECLVLVRDFNSVRSRRVDCLHDVELAHLLKNITDKGAVVTIVLDCCHSGGATRGCPSESFVLLRESYENSVTRGVDSLPEHALVERKPISFRAPWAASASRSAVTANHWITSSQGVEFLAACSSDQKAQEIRVEDGRYRGLLTECLLNVLRDPQVQHEPLTCDIIYNLVAKKVAAHPKRTQPQTVVFGGVRGRFFFGAGWSGLSKTTVTESELLSNGELQIKLSTGEAHGAIKGDTYALYPPHQIPISLMDYNSPPAICEISEVHKLSSKAIVKHGPASVRVGCLAVRRSEILEKKVLARRSAKLLLPHNPSTEICQLMEWLKNLAYSRSLVDFTSSESPFFQIRSDSAGRFEIAFSSKRETTVSVQSGIDLLSHLLHMSIYYNLLDLTTPFGCNGGLFVEKFGYLPSGIEPPVPYRHNPNSAVRVDSRLKSLENSDPQEIFENDSIGIRVWNNSQKKMFIEILDLEPSWQATKVYPIRDNSPTLVLAGEAVDFFLEMSASESVTHPQRSGFDTIIVLGTTNERGNFPKEILPRLGEAPRWQDSPFEKADVTRGARGFDSEQWYAQRVDVRVLKSGPE